MNVSVANSCISELLQQNDPPLLHATRFYKSFDVLIEHLRKSLSLPCLQRLFFDELKNQSMDNETLKNFHDLLVEKCVSDVKSEFFRLSNDGRVVFLLNKLDTLIDSQKALGPDYVRTPKWRPSASASNDLRPYKLREMRAYKERLLKEHEKLKTEKKPLIKTLIAKRQKFSDLKEKNLAALKEIELLRRDVASQISSLKQKCMDGGV